MPAGRPRLEINPEMVEELAALGCKNKEIAILLGCSTDTLERNFAAEMERGRENLKMSLRRWQLESAKRGNVVMLIWLGKQMLGQTDRVETLNTVQVKPLEPKEVLTILREDPFLNGNDTHTREIADAEFRDPKTGEDLPEAGSGT